MYENIAREREKERKVVGIAEEGVEYGYMYGHL